ADERSGAPLAQQEPERRRHRCRDERQHLPLRDLRTDQGGDQDGCSRDARRKESGMSTATTTRGGLSRRGFLQTSAVAGGGLAVGVNLAGLSVEALAAGTIHTPNAWVHIGDDNTITLFSARSEMGQVVYTSMPMLIAEELNVDLASVKVAIAPPDPIYVNALLGAQITGGSTSVRDGWEQLRVSGAQVRTMLITAAAGKWNVDGKD